MYELSCPHITDLQAARRPGWKRGLTLIELLVATVIMTVVTTAAFTLFRVTAAHERRQQEVLTQTQNLRAALYAVSRDIRMAGSGLPMVGSQVIHVYVPPALADPATQNGSGWFTYAGETRPGVRAIFGTDSGTQADESDTLTIFRAEQESTYSLGQLSAAFTPGSSNSLTLKKEIEEGETFSSGDILAIASGSTAVIVQAMASAGAKTRDLNLGDRFRPGASLPGDLQSFPEGSMVYNLRDVTFVTYFVDTVNHRLMANYHDATLKNEDADDPSRQHLVTVADNIEDFQVAYWFSRLNNPDLDLNPDIALDKLDDGNVVNAVYIAMVSRSGYKSELNAGASSVEIMSHLKNTAKPSLAFGHRATEDKGYTRRVMTDIIQLRNY